MADTSGLLLSEYEDGHIVLGYVDHNVEFFGGGDYECFYELDAANSDKLRSVIKERGFDDLKAGLIDAVGKNFDDAKFRILCKNAGITYTERSYF